MRSISAPLRNCSDTGFELFFNGGMDLDMLSKVDIVLVLDSRD